MGKGRIYQLRLEQGFALPVVLVTSVVMLIVLLASLTATSSISAGLKSQYINQLSDEAAQSGMAMAKACMEGNKGAVTWANAEPLMPNTDCKGNETTSCPATSTNSACYVLKSNNFRTTFKVGVTTDSNDDAISVDSHGIVREVRKTSGEVANESSEVVKLKLKGPSLTWRQISVSGNHVCAIASDNNAYCWGGGSYLGTGTSTASTTPVPVTTSGLLAGKSIRSLGTTESYSSCAIASDNNAYCWGLGSDGRLGNNSTNTALAPVAVTTSGVLSGKSILSIASAGHSCAIASDNNAYCWGLGSDGQLGNNLTNNYSVPVAVTTTGVLAGKTLREIDVGYRQSCAIASDNNAYCWGGGSYGALGNGTTSGSSKVPVAVTNIIGQTVSSIAVGNHHACVIASDNNAYCWGHGDRGQRGDGQTNDFPYMYYPVSQGDMPSGATIRSIAAGGFTTCAIASDNKAYCWGSNVSGQLGNGTTTNSSTPVAVAQGEIPSGVTMRSISTDGSTTCALASNNNAYCWGSNSFGQLGNGTSGGASSVPVGVAPVRASGSGLLTTNDLTAGGTHACAIASDNNAYCWGGSVYEYCDYDPETYEPISCNYPVLGNGTSDTSSTPVAVSPIAEGKTILSLSSSSAQVCALASDSMGYCWGEGITSASGLSASPIPVGGGVRLRAIEAGDYHTCAIVYNNKAYCWGSNGGSQGKFGNNTTSSTWTSGLVAVSQGAMPAGAMVRQMSAGANHTCVIASDNNAYCWGYNAYVQLGDGTYDNRQIPTAVRRDGVLAGKTVRQISAGLFNTCVIASDNKAYCWGNGTSGVNGNGVFTTPSGYVPVAVSGGYTFSSISVGSSHACGVTTDSKAYCWGSNSSGQLGDGTKNNSPVPVAVSQGAMPSGATVRLIKAGASSTCAIASNNKTYCWGSGQFGQLGTGNNAGSLRPSLVKPFPAEKSFSTPGYIY